VLHQHGKAFTAIGRAKGYQWRAKKNCFANAANLALEGRGHYCEGLATLGGRTFPHAWVSRDGSEAIEVTLRVGERAEYFGIMLPLTFVERMVATLGEAGPWLDYWNPACPEAWTALRSRSSREPRSLSVPLLAG
jgi:hypothetical protein